MTFSITRCTAFAIKESYQVFRDPSSILIAFVLPLIFLFLFGYGVSLDANTIRVGIIMEDTSPEARRFAEAFEGTPYYESHYNSNRRILIDDMIRSHLRGAIVIPNNFTTQLRKQMSSTTTSQMPVNEVQIIGDGSETNTATFMQNYGVGIIQNWAKQLKKEGNNFAVPPIDIAARIWFNPALKSRNTLLSGSIAITMSLIGVLLTALVVAREWERGTMEAILATPIRIEEFMLGKLTPYFILGIGSMTLCVAVSIIVFDVPFLGSYIILFLASSIFLCAGLSMGLLISTASKNQFVATQLSLMIGFLPAFILSGFIYEISSMPPWVQVLTYLLPARYFVNLLQTIFLAGNVWSLLIHNMLCLLALSVLLLSITRRKIKKQLE